MEAMVFRKFQNVDIYLKKEGKEFYISFGSPNVQTYWTEALNKILETRPNYEFDVETPDGQMHINIQDLKHLLEDIDILNKVL